MYFFGIVKTVKQSKIKLFIILKQYIFIALLIIHIMINKQLTRIKENKYYCLYEKLALVL